MLYIWQFYNLLYNVCVTRAAGWCSTDNEKFLKAPERNWRVHFSSYRGKGMRWDTASREGMHSYLILWNFLTRVRNIGKGRVKREYHSHQRWNLSPATNRTFFPVFETLLRLLDSVRGYRKVEIFCRTMFCNRNEGLDTSIPRIIDRWEVLQFSARCCYIAPFLQLAVERDLCGVDALIACGFFFLFRKYSPQIRFAALKFAFLRLCFVGPDI